MQSCYTDGKNSWCVHITTKSCINVYVQELQTNTQNKSKHNTHKIVCTALVPPPGSSFLRVHIPNQHPVSQTRPDSSPDKSGVGWASLYS